jgi:acylphosphatase
MCRPCGRDAVFYVGQGCPSLPSETAFRGAYPQFSAEKIIAAGAWFWLHALSNLPAYTRVSPAGRGFARTRMARTRMHILYSGRVQGVGFRYATKTVAMGFELTGTVRNLPDGRVELTVEGERTELEAFQEAIRDSGLGGFIRGEAVEWSGATGEFRGFEIVR